MTTITTARYAEMIREHLARHPSRDALAYGLGMIESAANDGDLDGVRAIISAVKEVLGW